MSILVSGAKRAEQSSVTNYYVMVIKGYGYGYGINGNDYKWFVTN